MSELYLIYIYICIICKYENRTDERSSTVLCFDGFVLTTTVKTSIPLFLHFRINYLHAYILFFFNTKMVNEYTYMYYIFYAQKLCQLLNVSVEIPTTKLEREFHLLFITTGTNVTYQKMPKVFTTDNVLSKLSAW